MLTRVNNTDCSFCYTADSNCCQYLSEKCRRPIDVLFVGRNDGEEYGFIVVHVGGRFVQSYIGQYYWLLHFHNLKILAFCMKLKIEIDVCMKILSIRPICCICSRYEILMKYYLPARR